MKYNLVSIVLGSFLLFSCSMGQEKVMHTKEQSYGQLPMAGARSINPTILDEKLRDLTNEAQSIETQMAVLLERLNNLRNEIAGYGTTQTTEVADAAPQAIIPTQEKPKPQKMPAKIAAKPKGVEKPAVTPVAEEKPAVVTGGGVNNIRVGLHSDKTRMVFDIDGSTKHTMNFDKEAGVVTITFPETKWSATKAKTFTHEQLSGYEAKVTEQGTIIAIAVNKARDVQSMALSNPNRLVLDILK